MSFNKDNASAYVAQNSKEIAIKSVTESKTAKLLIAAGSVQFDVKGSAKVLKADADSVFQDGKACGRTAMGDTKLSDKNISVAYIADKQDYCPKDLINTYYQFAVKPGAQPDQDIDAAVAQQFSDMRASKIAEKVEQLIWHGDVSLTSNNTLKWYDGAVKQILAGSYISVTHDYGETDIIKKLQQSYLKVPVAIRSKSDFRIFMGEKTYAEYKIKLDEKNYFNDKGEEILRGTNAVIVAVPGLDVAGKEEIIMARLSNLILGFDGSDETEKSTLRYSIETEKFYSDFFFSNGICVIYPEEVGYADYSVPVPSTTTTTTTTLG